MLETFLIDVFLALGSLAGPDRAFRHACAASRGRRSATFQWTEPAGPSPSRAPPAALGALPAPRERVERSSGSAHEQMIDELIERIASNKAELDRLRPLSSRALAHLEHAQDLELTYTSNAIEGNALTRIETQLVTEQGITIAGKRLKDHLEAIDHYDAVRYVREFARRDSRLGECEARNLHALALKRAAPEIAGRYATAGRHVDSGAGRREFPAPADVPGLMGEFSAWLSAAAPTPETAFAAHRRLIDIHPFHDGNGRVARLLMNLILIRGGYPPIAVRPEDRLAYVESLQKARSGQGAEAFRQLLYQRLDATLREHLSALRDAALPTPVASLVQSE